LNDPLPSSLPECRLGCSANISALLGLPPLLLRVRLLLLLLRAFQPAAVWLLPFAMGSLLLPQSVLVLAVRMVLVLAARMVLVLVVRI